MRSKEMLLNVFQQQRNNMSFQKGPPQSKLHRGGRELASSKGTMIPVPEESTSATTKRSLKTQVTKIATFFKEITQLIPLGELSSARQLVKKLFCKIPTVPLAGRLAHFMGSWEKLTKDQNILQKVKVYQIPFLCRPKQTFLCKRRQQSLEEGCCRTIQSTKIQFLGNIFIVKKRMGATDLRLT